MRANSSIFSFKVMLKIIKIIIFIAGIIPIIYYIGNKFENASEHNIINKHTQQRFEDFYSLPQNSIDIVFVGSSHSYCSFDPEIFDEQLGTYSFQMGTPLQHPDTTFFVLQEIFKYQKPQLVVYEIYWDMLHKEFDLKQANTLFEVLNDDLVRDKYISDVFPIAEKIKYYIKPIRHQQDYLAYKNKDIAEKVERKFNVQKKTKPRNGIEEYKAKGFVYCDIIMPDEEYDKTNQFRQFDAKNWEFNKTQKRYIEEALELIKQNNSDILFVTAPIANISFDYIKNYHLIHEQISNFAKKNNVEYIDFNLVNQNEKMLENEHFRDDAHLNYNGVTLINIYLIEWLKSRGFIAV